MMPAFPWLLLLLLTGCVGQRSEVRGQRSGELAELQDGVRLKYMTPLADPAFGKAEVREQRSEVRGRAVAVAAPEPWPRMAVLWSDLCDMNHPWVPRRVIYSGTTQTNLTERVVVANPFPVREWMSNGVYRCAFVPVTNGVTFAGKREEFFQLQ